MIANISFTVSKIFLLDPWNLLRSESETGHIGSKIKMEMTIGVRKYKFSIKSSRFSIVQSILTA
jgi:hypothetical protein